MTDPVQVEAARIPDRDRLLATLQEHGLDARPVGEVEIEIPVGDDDAGDEVFTIKHEGVIYVRPPIA